MHIFWAKLTPFSLQFELLPARWEQERFDLLESDSPGMHHGLIMLSVGHMKAVAGRKRSRVQGVHLNPTGLFL